MESYLVINGKKAPLTEEQLKMLGIATKKKSPFARENFDTYFYIDEFGKVCENEDEFSLVCTDHFAVANYCTNVGLLQQRAWHETLNRLLWRYAMERGGEGNYTIYCDDYNRFNVHNTCYKYLEPSFATRKTAENAIAEIVEPFMKEHPDFVW